MFDRILAIFMMALAQGKRSIKFGFLCAAVCLPMAVLLYGNLRSSIEELLPKSAPSIRALDALHRRLGDNLQLAVLISGAPKEDLHRFADALAAKASQLGANAPRFIDYRPAELTDFFRSRRALFVDVADLETIEKRIQARIDYEVAQRSPFSLELTDEAAPPPDVAFDDILKRYEKQDNLTGGHPSGYYDGEDGRSVAMIFYPGRGVAGYEASVRFRDELNRAAQQTRDEMGLSGVQMQYTGDIESLIVEQSSLQADLVTSSIVVLVAEAIVILVAFGWIPSLWALGLPLAIGTLATFAISYGAIGSVNASTAFLGSIIIGNGINPGIILLARFIEERRRSHNSIEAMRIAIRETALPTLVASTAAAVSYGALMITAFRGYSQFGLMGGTGMLLCWVTTFLFLPATATTLDDRWPVRATAEDRAGIWDRIFARLGSVSIRHGGMALVGAAALAVVAATAVVRFARDPFEYDTTRIMSSTATERGGTLEIDRKVDRILAKVLTPAVVLLEREEDVAPVASTYQKLIDAQSGHSVLGSVFTIRSLIPDDQPAKIAIIRRLRQMLRGDRLKLLTPEQRERAQDLLAAADLTPYGANDLPESIRRQVREVDGSEGKVVLLFPRHGSDTRDGRVVIRFANEVRSLPLPQGSFVAGSYLIFADMLDSIAHDGPLATVVALLAVVALSLALARGARGSFAVTCTLILGVLLTAGIAALFRMRINFLNFVALPITFGIGLDYAVNIYGRYRRSSQNPEALVEAVSHSSGAVALCSATTVIGYCSLLFSRNGALFSFGTLSVVGEIACLLCALLVLPAALNRRMAPFVAQSAAPTSDTVVASGASAEEIETSRDSSAERDRGVA